MVTKSYSYAVLFKVGNSEIRWDALAGVNQGLHRWPRLPEHRVRIVADWDPATESAALATERAQSLHFYLIGQGVDAARIDAFEVRSTPMPPDEASWEHSWMAHVEFYNARLDAGGGRPLREGR